MFFFCLALFAPPLIAMWLVAAKLLGYDIKWWQVFVVPVVVFFVGLLMAALPFLLLGTLLVISQ